MDGAWSEVERLRDENATSARRGDLQFNSLSDSHRALARRPTVAKYKAKRSERSSGTGALVRRASSMPERLEGGQPLWGDADTTA